MRLPLRGAIGCSTLMTMNDRPFLKCSVDPDQDSALVLGLVQNLDERVHSVVARQRTRVRVGSS